MAVLNAIACSVVFLVLVVFSVMVFGASVVPA